MKKHVTLQEEIVDLLTPSPPTLRKTMQITPHPKKKPSSNKKTPTNKKTPVRSSRKTLESNG